MKLLHIFFLLSYLSCARTAQATETTAQALLHRGIQTSDFSIVQKALALDMQDLSILQQELDYARTMLQQRQSCARLKSPALVLGLSGTAFAGGIWFAGETFLDIGYKYNSLKDIYALHRIELFYDVCGKRLTKQEINFFQYMQAGSRIPVIFWQEIASVGITSLLLYSGTELLKKAHARYKMLDNLSAHAADIVTLLELYVAKLES